MEEVVIVSDVRTAQGKFAGALKDYSAPQLGSIAIKEAVKRAGNIPEDVEEVIMCNVISAGLGQNVDRQAAIGAFPHEIGAVHVDMVCGSSLKAVVLAAQAIKSGDADIIVAGGAVALGHPIGTSGARILVTLIHAMRNYDKTRGLDTMCLGGGNVVSMVVERCVGE